MLFFTRTPDWFRYVKSDIHKLKDSIAIAGVDWRDMSHPVAGTFYMKRPLLSNLNCTRINHYPALAGVLYSEHHYLNIQFIIFKIAVYFWTNSAKSSHTYTYIYTYIYIYIYINIYIYISLHYGIYNVVEDAIHVSSYNLALQHCKQATDTATITAP